MAKSLYLLVSCALLLTYVSLSHARADVEKAIQLFAAERYSEGKALLEQFLATHQHDAEAHYYLGRIYLKLQNYDEAARHCKQAVKIQKSNAEHHFCLGLSYGKQAQQSSPLKKAFLASKIKKSFKKTVELDPNHVQGRIGLTKFYLQAPAFMGGDIDKAYEQATILLRLDGIKGRALLEKVRQRKVRASDAEATSEEMLSDS
ncbi:MAG: tetratricopeptide repeat protein [Candidatus Tectomicrobia bacterium]